MARQGDAVRVDIPAPGLPRPRPPPPAAPLEPPTQTIVVQLPAPPDAISQEVMDEAIRDVNARPSSIFAWPNGGPLSCLVVNGLNATVRIELHGGLSDDTSLLLRDPIYTFEVAAGERALETVHPAANRKWAPVVFARVVPLTVPTAGNLQLTMIRTGA